VYEHFTDRARRVLVLAQEESRLLNHEFIGTEHILAGLIHEDDGIAAQALEALGITLEDVRDQIQMQIGNGTKPPTGSPPFTARAKHVLELALRETKELESKRLGTEHLLLGLVREPDGVGTHVLESLGATPAQVRDEVLQRIEAAENSEDGTDSTSYVGEPPEESADGGYRSYRKLVRSGTPVLVVVVILVVATLLARRRGYNFGRNTIVRCRQGHMFSTIWIPGASLKSLRLGWARLQRCPIGQHWSLVTPVRVEDLSAQERKSAYEHHDVLIP
jgi:ATP-dependent Clp protease ATP-binding subunit ClpA